MKHLNIGVLRCTSDLVERARQLSSRSLLPPQVVLGTGAPLLENTCPDHTNGGPVGGTTAGEVQLSPRS